MNILNIQNISMDLGDRMLFEDISLGVQDQEKIGIIGRNGCGKSTMLKMIAGLVPVEKGEIIKANHIKVAYLPQTPEFTKEDTVLHYVMEEEKAGELWVNESDAKKMLLELQISDFTAPLSTLSGGQRKRVSLVKTLLHKSDLLLLDEPTNHLDSTMIEWLQQYLKNYKGAFLMVTHDRYFLDNVTTKIVEISKKKLYEYDTNYSGFLVKKAEREESEQATYDKSRNLYRNELKWVRRGAKARSTKQKARLSRFEELSNMRAPEKIGSVQLESIVSRMGKKTIECSHVSKAYGDNVLLSDFNYAFLKEQNVGFVGPNGCGKSTLLNIITGKLAPDEGEVTIGETIKIGYFAQHFPEMDGSLRVIDYVKEIAEYLVTPSGTISASAMCERFLFDPVMQYIPIEKLSGGEKRRLYLLSVLMGAPNVLVLDEPTNDLDIATLTVLESYLDHFNGILIVVSHDRYFLDRTVDRIFAFEGNGTLVQYEGGYTDYYLKKSGTLKEGFFDETEPRKGKSSSSGEVSEAKQAYRKEKSSTRARRFSYKEQQEYQTIEEDIMKMEDRLAEIDEEMAAKATSYTALSELTKEREELSRQREEKYERWEYLSQLEAEIAAQKDQV